MTGRAFWRPVIREPSNEQIIERVKDTEESVLIVDDVVDAGFTLNLALDFFAHFARRANVASHIFFHDDDANFFPTPKGTQTFKRLPFLFWFPDKAYTGVEIYDDVPERLASRRETDPLKIHKAERLRAEIKRQLAPKENS